jgi:ribosomal-protein-alanine N-acetyltransferase
VHRLRTVHPRLPTARDGSTFLVISTERLIIRPFQESDYQDIHEYMSAPETFIFERGKPLTLKETKKFCAEFAGKTKPGFWAAQLKGSGKVIGQVSFFPVRKEEFRTWYIGYIFNPTYYGQGYATEAARAVIKHAFTQLNAHRIEAYCSPENIPSWKVLEKCGMKREGLLRKNFLLREDAGGNPIWLDSYEYAIIDEDLK